MTETFGTATIEGLARELREPAWLTQLRHKAWAAHTTLPWPHASDDVWRRTDVSLLDPLRGFEPTQASLLSRLSLTETELARFTRPLGNEQLAVRVNGAWLVPPGGQGVVIQDLTEAAHRHPDTIRSAIEADGLSPAEQKLTSLNVAFHHDDLFVQVPAGSTGAAPFRFVHIFSASAKQAIFPMTIITVGSGSTVTLIDEYASLEPAGSAETPHLVNARIELVLEPNATVHYVRLQRWGAGAREFLLLRASLAKGATLTMANINLGASLSKAHLVTKLAGEQASTKLCGFVFGHGRQHVDQHTLQDHQAPRTESDLQFRAALQDESRMIYTGLIRIAKEAQQTHAYQANHNLMLSNNAKAETIPMLEILADDVQCKHGASIGPIDDEQAFYLMSRGVPREVAQRLIVLGFIEPIVQHIPFEPLQEQLRREIEGSLRS